MSEFSDIITNAMDIANVSNIAEIGAEYGGMTTILAKHAASHNGRLFSIDPNPKPEFLAWLDTQNTVSHIAKPSLEAFTSLSNIDLWMVDGDHNWFTVYHELKAISAACQRDEKPLFAILHDVCWPAGRRDMYYAPEAIPEEFRHDYCMKSGAKPGQSGLFRQQGMRGMGHFGWALHEGGERNGVKSAVEDFINEAEAHGQPLAYAEIPAVFGLGIIFDAAAPWAEDLSNLLLPFHDNPLIAKLEKNRLANYLTVLDWQDGVLGH
ncbi:MAG: class I SAM-dependent methyltransferase [Parasphingorhabdus sp.]|uniref:class I SAM-dependent methyltransferase n=1 Tax=Parasphingorhabdus sp. TaxID=2709688 RepID=UPI0032969A50